MYWITYLVGKKVQSSMLKADAWHHRSVALSSVGSLIGIIGARMGFILLDSIASLVICVIIVKISIDIFKESFEKLVDKSCDVKTKEEIKSEIQSIEGVKNIDDLKTRIFGDKIFVDVEISVDPLLTVKEGHDIAENVHNKVENLNEKIKHCLVHVNPYNV